MTALPTIMERLLNRVPWLLTLCVVGFSASISSIENSAVALATTVCNVGGLSLTVGLSMCGVTTLVGQAKGSLAAAASAAREFSKKYGHDEENADKALEKKGETTPLLLPSTPQSGQTASGDALLVYLFRALFIHLCVALPVGIIWLIPGVMSSALVGLGQEPNLASLTEQYLNRLVPGLWAFSIYFTMSTWFTSVEMAYVSPRVVLVGVIVHIPILIWSVQNYGYLGGAFATSAYQITVAGLIMSLLFINKDRIMRNALQTNVQSRNEEATGTNSPRQVPSPCLTSSVAEISGIGQRQDMTAIIRKAICSSSGLRQYLSLSLPGIIIISEWWASEVAIFLAGHLSPSHVTAMSIYQTLLGLCFQFSIAIGAGASTRIANNLGGGRILDAEVSALASVFTVTGQTLMLSLTLFLLPHKLYPSLFSREAVVIEEVARCVPWLCFYVVGDGITCVMGGILRACGRQNVAAPAILLAYWMIGLPLGYYITFYGFCFSGKFGDFLCSLHGHTAGLVAGMTIGTYTHMSIFAILVFRTDWKMEAAKANHRTANL